MFSEGWRNKQKYLQQRLTISTDIFWNSHFRNGRMELQTLTHFSKTCPKYNSVVHTKFFKHLHNRKCNRKDHSPPWNLRGAKYNFLFLPDFFPLAQTQFGPWWKQAQYEYKSRETRETQEKSAIPQPSIFLKKDKLCETLLMACSLYIFTCKGKP